MGRAYQNRKESMAKTSDQKARVYSRHARVIYVTAKQGGIDPEGNLALLCRKLSLTRTYSDCQAQLSCQC